MKYIVKMIVNNIILFMLIPLTMTEKDCYVHRHTSETAPIHLPLDGIKFVYLKITNLRTCDKYGRISGVLGAIQNSRQFTVSSYVICRYLIDCIKCPCSVLRDSVT